jgi:protein-disulfide isomerase
LGEKKFKRQRPAWPLLTGLALFVFAAVSCSGAAGEGFQSESGGAGPGGEQAAVDLEHPSLGDENAPVVLTEYADYQ